jgi:hypothetical protein
MSHRQATLDEWRRPVRQEQIASSQINNTLPRQRYLNTPTNYRTYDIEVQDQSNNSANTIRYNCNQPILLQQHINPTFNTISDKLWGHHMPQKMENTVRIGLRNINSLPLKSTHSKNDIFIQDIMNGQFDIFCATEVNLAWQNLDGNNKLYERFRGKLEFCKYITSNNKDPTYRDQFQRGGTLTMCSGPLCARITNTGSDNNLAGRWSWMKFTGKNGLTLVVVTLYRPVYSKGATSTYQQQKSIILDQNIDVCPQEQLLQDLLKDMVTWIQAGHQIIITGDFNEDVRGRNIKTYFHKLDMRELIHDQHGNKAPNTYIDGSTPIDGIFGTQGIQALFSGYSAFTWGMYSDHRLLWIDIDMESILGTNQPPLWKPQARRLKCENPTLVKKFNLIRMQHARQHNIEDTIKHIQHQIDTNVPMEDWSIEFEALDVIRIEGVMAADAK